MSCLTIILATRGRPHLLFPTIWRTLENVKNENTRLVIAIDHDDDVTREAFFNQAWDERVIPSVMPREDTLGEKYNNRLAVAPADVYLAMVDYAPHVTPGFDQKILDAADLFIDGVGVVYNRLENLSFPQINAVTHRMAELMGGMYPPHFPYWFVDHWLDDIARMVGRIAYADVQIDTSRRPGTMEFREPPYWGTIYDSLAPMRHRIATKILDECGPMGWRRRIIESGWPLIDQRSVMINENVRQIKSAPLPTDERYRRVKANAHALALAEVKRKLPLVLNQPYGQQCKAEMDWFVQSIKGARSLLEIGSCFGHSLRLMAEALEPGAVIRSIDLGRSDEWLEGIDTAKSLRATINDLWTQGFEASCAIGSSHNDVMRERARDGGPYDVVFIDGDHSYEGAKADWEHYGPLGRVVAFHDIAKPEHGVGKLWAEIKAAGYQTHECIQSDMGIGVVVMSAVAVKEARAA